MDIVSATQSSLDQETKSLWLFGPVDDSMAQLAIPAITLMDAEPCEDDDDESLRPIIVHIMSDGGCIQTGLAVYDALRRTTRQVVTVAYGDVLSTAVLMFLAGDIRMACPNVSMMLHRPYNSVSNGNLGDHKRASESLTRAEERMVRVWREAGLDLDLLSPAVLDEGRELWLDGSALLEYGLVTATWTPRGR